MGDVLGAVSRGAELLASTFGAKAAATRRPGAAGGAATTDAEYWRRGRDTWPAEESVLAHFLGAGAPEGPPPASQAPLSLAEAVDW